LFEQAVAYEENHSDGRTYTWTQGETLRDLIDRKDEIIASHQKAMLKEKQSAPNRPLAVVMEKLW
jgi:predicted RNase H-like HicB family nuclease